jgi:peptidoglycan-associated lipoprotein
MRHICVFVFAVVMLLMAAGCHHHQAPAPVATAPAVQPPATAPEASLTVSPDNVQRGQQAELRWNTQHASTITIDGIGAVSASGSKTITPAESTTYHLVAKGEGGSTEANARLTVSAPPPPKAATISDDEQFRRSVKDIFFSYDNAAIRAEDQAAINADAQFLAAHPGMRLLIEGHCDERGSEDYNMALGQNRAGSVQQALLKAGISADRIRLISYGKERPFCTTAENESCWQQNRRAHFVLARQ